MGGGGAERQLSYLTAGLVDEGWEVHTALISGGPNLTRLADSGAAIHWVHAVGNYDPLIVLRLVRLMSRIAPDVVHNWIPQMEIYGGIAAHLLRIPWVISERSSPGDVPFTPKTRLRLAVASQADAVVSNSEAARRFWQSRLPGVLTYVIPNAVPLREIDQVGPADLAQLGAAADGELMLYVGRFAAEKNLRALTAALDRVLRRPHTVAMLLGDGPLRPEVERWAQGGSAAGRVFVPGYVDDPWRWMKRASVLVSPSLWEGQPNAVLEAMACRCPVVVSDIGAHREILNEDAAIFVRGDDPRSIAEGVEAALERPEQSRQRAESARARVQRWSIPAVTGLYMQVYHDVMHRRGRERMDGRIRPATGTR